MDVTPRLADADADPDADGRTSARGGRRRGGRGLLSVGIVVLLLGAAGFLLVKQLGDATVYYRNADAAVRDKAELGDRRFRIQGTFVGSKRDVGNAVAFTIAFNGVKVPILHTGSEPAMFRPGIPVVAEGRWSADGTTFLSDRIEVKHSETYRAKNPGRVGNAP